MKKIYLFSILLMGVMAASAQPPTCATGISAKNYTVPFTPPYNKLFIENGPLADPTDPFGTTTNRPRVYFYDGDGVVLKDGGGIPISVQLDANGNATYEYSGQLFIGSIQVDYYVMVGGVAQIRSCSFPVSQGGPLPIKLTAFTGRLQSDNSVILDWTSSIEENSFRYEVMRSTDGKYWESVGTLQAAGTSTKSIKYTFDDQLPTAGAYFYRLKQVDIDGKFEYSKVVYVNSKKGAGVVSKLFPNPTRGEIQLVGATSVDLTPNNLNIFSIAGQRVKYRVVGANAISLDPSAPDGVYILKMKTAAGMQQFKVIKNQSAGNY